MDGSAFDRLTKTLLESRSRRGLSRLFGGLAVGGPLALLGAAESTAKKKKKPCPPCKKRKQGKCKGKLPDGAGCRGGTCQGGRCVAATPPPGCTPNCFDRVCGPDGCGGSCGTCSLLGSVCNRGACECPADKPVVCGGACAVACQAGTVRHPQTCGCCIPSRKDCVTACAETCCSGRWLDGQTDMCWGFGTGEPCTFNEQCHSLNCVHGRCEECYEDTNFCYDGFDRGYGTDSNVCGPSITGQCLKTVDGPPRCGVRNSNVACNGCRDDIDCQVDLGQGSGAFCVRASGSRCDCPDGQTFCAVPR
jgi:hypothetical protein